MDAVLRLKGSTNLDAIQIIKKPGGTIKVGAWLARSTSFRLCSPHQHVPPLCSLLAGLAGPRTSPTAGGCGAIRGRCELP